MGSAPAAGHVRWGSGEPGTAGSPWPCAELGGLTGTAWMDITDLRGLGPVHVSTCSPGICADSTS